MSSTAKNLEVKRFAMHCGTPMIPTMHVPKAELYCLECGASVGLFSPMSAHATDELREQYNLIKAEWDEHVGGRLLVPRSRRRDCAICERDGGFDHPTHATDEEKAADAEARAWLKARMAKREVAA